MRALLLASIISLLLTGCSSTTLAYRYADWGIVWWIDDYIPMTDAQQAQLEKDVQSLQRWHCRTELPRYSDWLVSLKQDVEAESFDQSRVQFHQEQLFSFFTPLMERAKPAAVRLLSSLSDEQVNELADNMAESQKEFEEEFLADSPEDTREARADRTAERVERWLGDLSEQQMGTVRQWSNDRGEQTQIWLEGRRNWQKAFLEALKHRTQDDFPARVSYLIDNSGEVRGARYQQMIADSRASMAGLMSDLLKQADDQQLNHLLDKAASLRGDFDSLHANTCEGDAGAEQTAQAS